MQWGSRSCTRGGVITVNFPLTAAVCYAIVGTGLNRTESNGNGAYNDNVANISGSGFQWYSGSLSNLCWIAICKS